jgi:Domain of unknown function (DU1801)
MTTQNKTQITDVAVEAFLATLPSEARQSEAHAILKLMAGLTEARPKMWGPSIIGFGVHHYKYDSGREGTSPIVAFSPRKAQLVFYGLGVAGQTADTLGRLGKHTTGKGCLYVKKLGDIDQKTLGEIIATAWHASNDSQPA